MEDLPKVAKSRSVSSVEHSLQVLKKRKEERPTFHCPNATRTLFFQKANVAEVARASSQMVTKAHVASARLAPAVSASCGCQYRHATYEREREREEKERGVNVSNERDTVCVFRGTSAGPSTSASGGPCKSGERLRKDSIGTENSPF